MEPEQSLPAVTAASRWFESVPLGPDCTLDTRCSACAPSGECERCDTLGGRWMDAVNEYSSTCDGCAELTSHEALEADPRTNLGYCERCRPAAPEPISPEEDAPTPPRRLSGLQRLCKAYGGMKLGDVKMVWDYAQDCAVPEKEMPSGGDRWRASERARWKPPVQSAPEPTPPEF